MGKDLGQQDIDQEIQQDVSGTDSPEGAAAMAEQISEDRTGKTNVRLIPETIDIVKSKIRCCDFYVSL